MENARKDDPDLDRFGQAIDALLSSREALLVRYCGLLSLGLDDRDALGQALVEFNQTLTDYLALGHFEVLEPSVADAERGGADREPQRAVTAAIRMTTDRILGFTERYGVSHPLVELAADLEQLGQVMANRFELEDRFLREARPA
ncbi:MAG: Rsd/AlgQ family anti-sigma factor [Thiotrichales bacterium]